MKPYAWDSSGSQALVLSPALDTTMVESSGSIIVATTTPGYAPYAYQAHFAITDTSAPAAALAVSGGSVAIPIIVPARMLLQSITVRQTDASGVHTAEWRLYIDKLNTSNSLDEVPNANGTFSFTPGAASNQTSTPGTTPIYLAPGLYWLVIRNTSGAVIFNMGTVAGGTMALNTAQTKTLASGLGATLDFVAATWTKVTSMWGVRLNGRVFGQSTSF